MGVACLCFAMSPEIRRLFRRGVKSEYVNSDRQRHQPAKPITATIRLGDSEVSCEVQDLSPGGLAIRTRDTISLIRPEQSIEVRLRLDSDWASTFEGKESLLHVHSVCKHGPTELDGTDDFIYGLFG